MVYRGVLGPDQGVRSSRFLKRPAPSQKKTKIKKLKKTEKSYGLNCYLLKVDGVSKYGHCKCQF